MGPKLVYQRLLFIYFVAFSESLTIGKKTILLHQFFQQILNSCWDAFEIIFAEIKCFLTFHIHFNNIWFFPHYFIFHNTFITSLISSLYVVNYLHVANSTNLCTIFIELIMNYARSLRIASKNNRVIFICWMRLWDTKYRCIQICWLENMNKCYYSQMFFAIFIRKHQCWSLFFDKVAGLNACNFIKKALQHRSFLVTAFEPEYSICSTQRLI